VSNAALTLVNAGMGEAQARAKASLFSAAQDALHGRAAWGWFVPGRIEILGKHTDYAGGRSLLCAAERGMCVVAAPRGDAAVRIEDVVRRQALETAFSEQLETASGWHHYAATVIRRLARNFGGNLRGADIAIASDLPPAAGMSSSSVLMIGVFTALSAVNELAGRSEYREDIRTAEELAAYLACMENGQSFGSLEGDQGVGTFGGSEDHTAILCSRAGHAAQYRFSPVTLERRIRVPAESVFVIATSGVAANKTSGARERYNRASLGAAAVLRAWNAASGRSDSTLYAAVTHAHDAPERIREALARHADGCFSAEQLRARFDQFFLESQAAVPAGAAALAMGAFEVFGKVADCSQAAAERLLGNQVPETVELARSARDLGALAASAFGAGFGGSVWALIAAEDAKWFPGAWQAHYRMRFPAAAATAEFFVTAAGPPLVEVPLA
jgi:galactokinase